jgi:hypothetical protein
MYVGETEYTSMLEAHKQTMSLWIPGSVAMDGFVGLDDVEIDRGKKIVNWSRHASGRAPHYQGPANPVLDDKLAAEWKRDLRAVLDYWLTGTGRLGSLPTYGAPASAEVTYAYRPGEDPKATTLQAALADAMWMPADRANGWPDHTSGPDMLSKLCHARLAAHVLSSTQSGAYHGVCSMIRAASGWDGPYATEYYRIQDGAKEIPLWVDDGSSPDGIVAYDLSVGEVARWREINAVALFPNIILRRLMGFLKWALRRVPNHQTQVDRIAYLFYMVVLGAGSPGDLIMSSTDFEKFDHSALVAILKVMIDVVRDVVPDLYTPGGWDAVYSIVVETPTLCPRVSSQAAGYIIFLGYLLSGLSTTSVFGCWANSAVNFRGARRSVKDPAEALRRGEWTYWAWGDDAAKAVKRSWIAGMSQAAEEVGFVTKSSPGLHVLRTALRFERHGRRAFATGVAMSIWSNRFNKESMNMPAYPTTDEEWVQADMMSAVGAFCALQSLRQHPMRDAVLNNMSRACPRAERVMRVASSLTPSSAKALVKAISAGKYGSFSQGAIDEARRLAIAAQIAGWEDFPEAAASTQWMDTSALMIQATRTMSVPEAIATLIEKGKQVRRRR